MDEKAEKKLNKKLADRERQRQLRRDEFVKAACTTPEGREYFYWLMEITRVNSNPFTGNALSTMFGCGELEVGRVVREHLVKITPKGYLHILTEKQEEEVNDRLEERNQPEPE